MHTLLLFPTLARIEARTWIKTSGLTLAPWQIECTDAKRALELLNCANIKELRTRVNDASSYCSLTEEFIDPENPHYERVEDFVCRALEVP